MNIRLILAALGVCAAFIGGWEVNGWRMHASQVSALTKAQEQLQADWITKVDAEQTKSLALSKTLDQAKAKVKTLKAEVERAKYKAPPKRATAPVKGVCPAHPIDDPRWLRDYNRAANPQGGPG